LQQLLSYLLAITGTTQSDNVRGKDRLQKRAKLWRIEYKKLTEEEKERLVAEMEQAKTTKAKGRRISARSKVNDVTQTIAVIENEVSPCISFGYVALAYYSSV